MRVFILSVRKKRRNNSALRRKRNAGHASAQGGSYDLTNISATPEGISACLVVAHFDPGDMQMAVKKKNDTSHKADCVCAVCEKAREQARIDNVEFPAKLYVEPAIEGQPETYHGLPDMAELPDGCLVAVYELRHIAIVRETVMKKLDIVNCTEE